VKVPQEKPLSVTFDLADAQSRQAFADKCVQEYGIEKSSVYLTDYGQLVIVDNLSRNVAERLSKEYGVTSVFEDAPLSPF
jgi:hypothetical protein